MSLLQFQISKIKTEQFAILTDHFKVNDIQRTSLNIKFDFKVNFEHKVIGTFFTIIFEREEEKILLIEVSCHFAIEAASWDSNLIDNGSSIKIEKEPLIHLALITVGTTRGVLFSKLENTIMSSVIIPSINITELIKEDAIFSNNS
jgi:hypothetical protein